MKESSMLLYYWQAYRVHNITILVLEESAHLAFDEPNVLLKNLKIT